MDKPRTRLDTRKHRRQLREIGSLRRSDLPEKTKNRLRIISWYGRKSVETICSFFEISKSWFYRLLNTFLREGLEGLTKRPGRPRGSTIPEPTTKEIKRIREANPRTGSRIDRSCPNRGLEGRSPAEVYGRPISHRENVEAFYRLYLGEPPPWILVV